MKKFYAVCNVNGPISVRLEAGTLDDAIAEFEAADGSEWVDDPRMDAEYDFGITGEGMSEDQFGDALTACGCVAVKDLDEIINAHAGWSGHLLNGWYLWEAPMVGRA